MGNVRKCLYLYPVFENKLKKKKSFMGYGFFYPHHTPIIDPFSCIPFDLPHLIFKVESAIKYTFSFKEFLHKFKEVDATSDSRSVPYVDV